MSNTIAPAAGRVTITNGQPTTTTQDIAEVYGKRHDNVLSVVRQRMVEAGDWGVLNFWETPYTNPQNGQVYPAYHLTRDGFTLLAMGFTGKKALQFKLAYIDAFNRMESELAGRSALSLNQTLRSLANLGYTCPQVLENTFVPAGIRARQFCGFFMPKSHGRGEQKSNLRCLAGTRFSTPCPPSLLENSAGGYTNPLPEVSAMTSKITLAVTNGVPTTTTLDVAAVFNKPHRHVVRAVETLIDQLGTPLPNFGQGYYTLPETGNQQHKQYTLTRDGFTLLAMGFTGKKALQFKLAYIEAFNRMESELAGGSALSLNQTLRSLASQLRQPNGYPASLFAPLVQAYLDKTGQTLADTAALAATAKPALPAAGAIPLSAPPRLPGLSVSKLCDAQASAGDCRAITCFWQAYVAGDITGSAALPIPSRLLYWFYERWCVDQGVYATGFAILIDHLKTQHGVRVLRKRYQVRSVALGPHSFLYPRGTTKPAGKCESQWLGSCLQALQTKGGKWKLKL